MGKRAYRDYSRVKFPCEFLNGTLRAYRVMIQGRELFLSRQHATKMDEAICIPTWLAKKEGLV